MKKAENEHSGHTKVGRRKQRIPTTQMEVEVKTKSLHALPSSSSSSSSSGSDRGSCDEYDSMLLFSVGKQTKHTVTRTAELSWAKEGRVEERRREERVEQSWTGDEMR